MLILRTLLIASALTATRNRFHSRIIRKQTRRCATAERIKDGERHQQMNEVRKHFSVDYLIGKNDTNIYYSQNNMINSPEQIPTGVTRGWYMNLLSCNDRLVW
jgi:hypothetical protein